MTAARDNILQWKTCHSDLWFKHINTFATNSTWLVSCSHCGQTIYYPENCNFCHSNTQPLDQQPVARPATNKDPSTPVCKDFNKSTCIKISCWYLHQCECCRGNQYIPQQYRHALCHFSELHYDHSYSSGR